MLVSIGQQSVHLARIGFTKSIEQQHHRDQSSGCLFSAEITSSLVELQRAGIGD